MLGVGGCHCCNEGGTPAGPLGTRPLLPQDPSVWGSWDHLVLLREPQTLLELDNSSCPPFSCRVTSGEDLCPQIPEAARRVCLLDDPNLEKWPLNF